MFVNIFSVLDEKKKRNFFWKKFLHYSVIKIIKNLNHIIEIIVSYDIRNFTAITFFKLQF